jgi:threonine synthase
VNAWRGVIETYRAFLPVSDRTPVVTLLEGNTPLVPAPRLAEATDPSLQIYLKCEGFNPTGSFKDRGMTMAISKALEAGSRAVICASTGNTSASAAAFAARAGIRAFVMVPRGSVALGKLSQAAIHGAKVLTVEGNFDQALSIVRQIAETHPVTLVNSVNPFRLEGQKTGAFEVVDQLGRAPDYHLIPVGNAGNITAYWRGYREYHRAGRSGQLPRMVGFQAAGAAPIYEKRVIEEPRTIATAIKIGNPASWGPALEALDDSRGWIDVVTDEEILQAYRMLAREEGIFMEPASAASVAGLVKSVKAGRFEPGSTLVLTLTGHGLKDPDTALESSTRPTSVPPSVHAVLAQLGL